MAYYEKNLELIRATNPELARKIDEAKPVAVEDPKSIIKDFLGGGLGKRGVVFLMGLGSGKFAVETARALTKDQTLIIFEADLGVFKYALGRRNLFKLFTFQNLMIHTESIEDFSFLNNVHMAMVNERCLHIEDKTSTKLHPEIYKKTMDRLIEEKNFLDVNLGTSLQLGRSFCNSVFQNVPKILESHGISYLHKLFPECPCIIVSSGPSLDKEYETLKAAKGKAVIICIDTALPLLLSHGLVPDIIAGIDPLNDNKILFKGHRDFLKNIPFVCMAQYTPDVLRTYPGPVFISAMPGNQAYNWLMPFWEDKGAVECFGGSVSHFATQIADWMGCREIALVGQDLCYKQKYHAGNITKLLHDGMGLEEPDETKIGIKTTNRLKEPVYTKPHLLTFRTSFENKIRGCPHLKFFNTSVDGLPISGAKFMPLEKFVRKYGIEIDAKMAFDSITTKEPLHVRDVLIPALGNAIDIFKKISRTALKIIRIIHKVQKLREAKGDHRKEIRTLVKEIEHLRPITQHPLTSLISGYYFHIEMYLKKSEVKDVDQIRHKWVRLDRQLERGLNFYGELREGVNLLNTELIKLKKQLVKTENRGNVEDGRKAAHN